MRLPGPILAAGARTSAGALGRSMNTGRAIWRGARHLEADGRAQEHDEVDRREVERRPKYSSGRKNVPSNRRSG